MDAGGAARSGVLLRMSETATVRVWRGRRNLDRDPDETHELDIHNGHRYVADTVTISESIEDTGWLAFDVVDLPRDVERVTLNVHADDSFHDPEPLDETPAERGLVFDGGPVKPSVDPPCFKLRGIVKCWVKEGGR